MVNVRALIKQFGGPKKSNLKPVESVNVAFGNISVSNITAESSSKKNNSKHTRKNIKIEKAYKNEIQTNYANLY